MIQLLTPTGERLDHPEYAPRVAHLDPDALRGALSQLCDLFAEPATWARMVANAMAQPVGW